MRAAKSPLIHVREITQALRTYWLWWVVPTVAMSVGALGFALVKQNTWQATQVLHLRSEAAGKERELGSFASPDAMKTAQDTLLELVLNQQALADALREVGPPSSTSSGGAWPGAADIDDLRSAISVSAPGGAEFGSTEVIHVSVKANDQARALALASAVCDQLEKNLQALRQRRTDSIIVELTKSQQLAEIDLRSATKKLEEFEAEIGGDLHELRLLNQTGTGESNLRLQLNTLKNDLRTARTTFEDKKAQLKHLATARQDTGQIVALPGRLLESQPALKQLKDGLVVAQIHRAQISSTLSPDHPKMQAAVAAEAEVLADLKRELEVAVAGLTADVAISKSLMNSLTKQKNEVENRLNRLAGLRARYGNLDAEVKQRSEILQKATGDLADARASRAAGRAASLITRIDAPQLATRPLGPGRTMICAAGLFGGLATGLGLVFLVSPQGQATGRRWSDSVASLGRRASDLLPGIGRRKSDLTGGRRNGDPPLPTPASTAIQATGDRRGSGDRRQ